MGSTFRKGSKESGQSGGASMEQIELAKRQMALAEEQAALTKPMRQRTADIYSQFLGSGKTPEFLDLQKTVSPLAALSLPGLQSQQSIVNKQLMAQGNRGGGLQQMLSQNALQGGLQRTGLMQQDMLRQEQRDVDRSGIARALFGGASDAGTGGLALAFQGIGNSMAGMGNASNNLNVLGAQRMGQNREFQKGLGALAGAGIGGAFGGPMGAMAGGSIGGKA